MKTYILATAAALLLVAGPALAYEQNFIDDTPSLMFRTAPAYSSGADLSVAPIVRGNGGYRSNFEQGRCVQAINANKASDVRAFCPPSKWNLVP